MASLVEPGSTAVLTMEMQRGVVGPGGMMPALAEQVAASGTIRVAASVCEAARAAGARVVHCTNQTRPDGAGGAVNCRILGLADRLRREHGIAPTQAGTDGARLVPELGEDPRDLVVARAHAVHVHSARPDPAEPRHQDRRGDGRFGERRHPGPVPQRR